MLNSISNENVVFYRFGRKCLFWMNLSLVLIGSAVAFAPNVWWYIFLRLMTGTLSMGVVVVAFTHGRLCKVVCMDFEPNLEG